MRAAAVWLALLLGLQAVAGDAAEANNTATMAKLAEALPTEDLEEVKALLEALEEGEEGPSKTEMMARLADFLVVAAVVDEPRLVLETAWGTLAVAKVSELGGSEMEVPGGAEVAFPAGTGELAGAAHIKVATTHTRGEPCRRKRRSR